MSVTHADVVKIAALARLELAEEELERLLDGLTPAKDGGGGEPPPTLH